MEKATGRAERGARVSPWVDRVAPYVIVAVGALSLILLAWDHLGLGAWLFPPVATPTQQVVVSAPYHLTLIESSGQLTARGANAITLDLRDLAGRPIADANIHLQPTMTAMPMTAFAITATPIGGGRYTAQLHLGMAGVWRLVVTVSHQGLPTHQVAFTVGVRW